VKQIQAGFPGNFKGGGIHMGCRYEEIYSRSGRNKKKGALKTSSVSIQDGGRQRGQRLSKTKPAKSDRFKCELQTWGGGYYSFEKWPYGINQVVGSKIAS